MAKQDTLQTIEREIAEGKLGIARDRMNGLVVAYPEDLSLRSGLGDIYFKLGYPIEAGRCWFFDEPLDEVKREAVARFLRSCESDPAIVLRRLKLRCSPERLSKLDAAAKVRELVEECRQLGLDVPNFPKRASLGTARQANWLMAGCLAVAALVLTLAVIGLIAVLSWGRSR